MRILTNFIGTMMLVTTWNVAANCDIRATPEQERRARSSGAAAREVHREMLSTIRECKQREKRSEGLAVRERNERRRVEDEEKKKRFQEQDRRDSEQARHRPCTQFPPPCYGWARSGAGGGVRD